ncbi:pentatricopeptide repeat-containing protein At1g05670, mitochondrial-like [Pyrus communis]|uniref:pentatricopeptide repeat-containing protein At1g05670, mitochondrial-like n=1 Tax=Pyrus communis TaxID=23211 RepID=UPI0035C078A5
MIHGFFKIGDIDSARSVLVRMTESRDCLPDRITCTILIDGYCKKGKLEEAMKCMYEMEKHGCEPNVITYSTMIHGFCRKGDFDSARRVLGRMRESKDCLPDLVTYTTLIDGYCKKGELEKVMKCMGEMEKLGCEPNLFSCNALIHALCLSGHIGEAKDMVTKMRLHGVEDDIVTHMTILKGPYIEGRPDAAAKHLKDIVNLGMKPEVAYVVIFNEYLICSLCDMRGRMGEVEELVCDMLGNGHELRTNLYGCIIKGYCEDGNVNMAVQTFCGALDNNNILETLTKSSR